MTQEWLRGAMCGIFYGVIWTNVYFRYNDKNFWPAMIANVIVTGVVVVAAYYVVLYGVVAR